MSRTAVGPLLVLAGAVLVVIGLLVWTGLPSWFGRLPGDLRVERQNTRVYIPITSMILVSIALSLFLALFRRFR